MLRLIKDEEGNVHPIIVIIIMVLLSPLFIYEGYLLMETAEQIEVEDIYVEDYTTEIEDETVTKIEMDLNIDIRNPTATNVEIEKLEYELMIKPDAEEDVELDKGEITDQRIRAGTVTTITMPIENEDEDDIESIENYILEEEGEVEAVVEIHVPLLQIYVDYTLTTVSENLDESFRYEPVLEDYEVEKENSRFERADEDDVVDYILKTPYMIETNDNEFVSGEVRIDITMESDDGEIESSDNLLLEIGEDKKDEYLEFGFFDEEIEVMMTEHQTIEFTSDLIFEDDITFKRDHDDIESEPMLVEYEIEGDQAELNEDEEQLEVPYYIKTQETAFFEEGGTVFVTTEMESEDGTVTSSADFDIEIGETEEGKLEFGLEPDEVDELSEDDKTLTFTSEIERDDVTFEYDHEEEGEWIAPN